MAGSARTCAERGLQPAALLLCLAAPPALAQNATGDPTITGAHRVGEELTVATDAIADPDGIVNATFAYRWIRVDDEGAETDIAGAIAATYTLAPADEGGQVRVRVTFTDDGGNTEERTSNAYPSSGAILPEAVCDVPSYIGGEREIWSAELTIGHFNEDTTEVYGFFEGLVGDFKRSDGADSWFR